MTLVNECELFDKYVPFCSKSTKIKQISKASKIAYTLMSFPMIADRECYFYGEGFDRFDVDGTLVVISKSVHDVI